VKPGGLTARRNIVMQLRCISWWRKMEVVPGHCGKKNNPMSSFPTILTGRITASDDSSLV
jgi:hypothetical protein